MNLCKLHAWFVGIPACILGIKVVVGLYTYCKSSNINVIEVGHTKPVASRQCVAHRDTQN